MAENKVTETNSSTVNGKRKYIIAAAAVIAVIAVIIVIISLGKGSTKPLDNSTPDEAATETVQEPTFVKLVEAKDTYSFDLGFVTLRYPNNFKDVVTVDGVEKHDRKDNFTLKFSCGDTQLFDLYFNSGEGNILGTLVSDEGNTVITVKTYVVDSNDIEMLERQESLNVIIEALISDYGFVIGEEIEDEDSGEVFEIETDLVTLSYPKKWQDKVDITVEDKAVRFARGEDKLFDLCFEECDGYLLGAYDGTPIYMVEYTTKDDEMVAMQSDVNVIIDYLIKDEKFDINA